MKKRHFVAGVAVCISGALCGCSAPKPAAEMSSQQRDTPSFVSINLLGSLDVTYKQSDECTVKVEAPSNIIDNIKTVVDNGCLTIKYESDDNWSAFNSIDNVSVSVTSPDLVGVNVAGSGSFLSTGLVDTDIMKLSLTGSGDLLMESLQCDRLKTTVTGSGDIHLKSVRTLDGSLGVTGSGDITAKFVESGPLDCRVTGSGDITVAGQVSQFRQSAVGSGEINAAALKIPSSSNRTRR